MPNIIEITVIAKDATKEGYAAATSSSDSFAKKLQGVGLIGGAALVAVGVASLDMATKFQSATTRLVTSAGETTKNIDLVRQGLLTMAGQVGISATDLANGMYTVESAGFHGAQGLTVLKAAAQGAKDENADLALVSNAVTDVLIDYHMKASDAADVTSKLVTAVSFGKTNFQDFSGAMANILPLASAMHLKMADVSGVLAEMTAHGMTADRASQDEANAMRSLMAPTAAMQKEFKELGINSDEVMQKLGTVGLSGTMQWLSGVAQDGAGKIGQNYTEAMKKLMGTAPGLVTALMTTGENAKSTNAAIAGISGATADASGNVKGFSEVQQTFGQQLAEVGAQAESMAIAFGMKLMPVVQDVLGWITSHQSVVKDLAEAIALVVAALAGYAIVAKTVAAAQAALDLVMDANPFVAIGIAVVAIAAVVVEYHKQILDTIEMVWNTISQFLTTTWNEIYTFFVTTWTDIYDFGKQTWDTIYNDTIGVVEKLFNDIEGFITGGFDGWWKSHGQEIEDVWKVVWTTVTDIFKVQWAIVSTIAKTAWDAMTAAFTVSFTLIETVTRVAWSIISSVFTVTMTVITSTLKIAWSLIEGMFKVEFAIIQGVAKVTWDAIAAYVKVVWAAIEALLKVTWDIIVGLFSVFLDLVTGHWSKAWDDVKNTGEQVWNAIKAFLSATWNSINALASQIGHAIEGTLTGVWNSIASTTRSVWNGITSFFSSFWDGLRKGFNSLVSDLGKIWDGLETVFKTPVNFLINTIYDNGIRRFWNDVVGSVGGPTLPPIPGLATGGRIPGFGGGDSVLAMLEPGEAVVDKHRTQKFSPLLRAMGVPGFSSGGIVGAAGDVGNLVMDAVTLNESGFISDFINMLPGGVGGALGQWATVIGDFPGAMVDKAVHAAWGKMTNLLGDIGSLVGGIFASSGSTTFTPTGLKFKAWVDQVLKMLNISTAMDMIVLDQILTESGGNPTAVNKTDINWQHGTPSVGVMQVIGPTFDAYAGPFKNVGPFMYGVSIDPLANIYAGMNYALHRYGSGWVDVLGHGHGYASGGATSSGWATVGEQGRELVKMPGGATVFSAGDSSRMVAGGASGVVVQLEISSSGQSDFDQFMLEWMRKTVRVKGGGVVQAAFGRY